MPSLYHRTSGAGSPRTWNSSSHSYRSCRKWTRDVEAFAISRPGCGVGDCTMIYLGNLILCFLYIRILTYSRIFEQMTQNDAKSLHWEANSRSASQKFPHLSFNPKVHYRFHNSPPLVSVLNHMNPVHTLQTYFPKIHPNKFPSTLRSSEWSFNLRFSDQNFVHSSQFSNPCYMPSPSYPWFDHPNNIWWSVQVMKLLNI